jgi:muramoyltetrapeptide carboxypeptidase
MPSAYLWCPAYPLEHERHLSQARHGARAFAKTCGLELVESPNLSRFGAAGSWEAASERSRDFLAALRHEVLLAARGGYGCNDLVSALDGSQALPRLIGYSDLTILHGCWRQRGQSSLYGFMPAVTCGERSMESTCRLLLDRSWQLTSSEAPHSQVIRVGQARGPCFAACLRVLAGMVGTSAMPSLAGTLLALEDIDERPYRIDRDLNQLWHAGALQGVQALLFAAMPCDLPQGYQGPSAVEIATRWSQRLGVPTVFGVPFGHLEDPVTLPCGRMGELEVMESVWRLCFPS